MEYIDHLSNIIRKSTFVLGHKYYKNGFIDPRGEWISCKSHHHVETALSIIKKYDDTEQCKTDIANIEKCISIIENWIKISEENPELSLQDITNNNKKDYKIVRHYIYGFDKNKNARSILCRILEHIKDDYKSTLSYYETAKKCSMLLKFLNANKTKGYDAAEFLIICYGYIAVEDGHLLYKNGKQTQVRKYNCYIDKDEDNKVVICKMTKDEVKQRIEKDKRVVINKASYYMDSRNRFHCPSGFPRCDYQRWERQCIELGINPSDLLYKQ